MNKARDMESEHDKMKSVMANIDSQVKTMLATWEGLASDTFNAKFTQLRPNVDEYLSIAKKYATKLNKLAENYTVTEGNVASEQSRLRTQL